MSTVAIEQTTTPHIPLWRLNGFYRSADEIELSHVQSGRKLARISVANVGLIRRDALNWPDREAIFAGYTSAKMIAICREAARYFMEADLPTGGEGETMGFEGYLRHLSASTGMPVALCRLNAEKIEHALLEMESVVGGLTRSLPSHIFNGLTRDAAGPMSFFPKTERLGVILPSNSPGVNSLWLPSLAMRMPVLLKPGREDPWTPFRLQQAFLAARAPEQAIGFFPSDHAGAAALIEVCGRVILFGDQTVADRYANRPDIEVHGPGRSKIVIGPDAVDRWPEYIDIMAESIARNGGRSCVNASAIHTPAHGAEIAEALARKLAEIEPLPLDDPQAGLAGFVRPVVAEWTAAQIAEMVEVPGARLVSDGLYPEGMIAKCEDITYLRPSVVHCTRADHPLANREFLFPFASVVDTPVEELASAVGPSLVVSVITRDGKLIQELEKSPDIQRLNVGPLPTTRIDWTQPHEGNLFEFLFQRRAAAIAEGW